MIRIITLVRCYDPFQFLIQSVNFKICFLLLLLPKSSQLTQVLDISIKHPFNIIINNPSSWFAQYAVWKTTSKKKNIQIISFVLIFLIVESFYSQQRERSLFTKSRLRDSFLVKNDLSNYCQYTNDQPKSVKRYWNVFEKQENKNVFLTSELVFLFVYFLSLVPV